jgi:uncharacterized protein YdiU (UPF0061 family)
MIQLNVIPGYAEAMPADPDMSNTRRMVADAYSYVTPRIFPHARLIHTSVEAAELLGMDKTQTMSEQFLKVFSGQEVYPGTHPYAMAYAGHQFGNWAGQLGDGRAINLFEVEHNGRWAVQLKGAGETPYSRHADGLAVLRSSIREHLCSEAMHHLGVPTTRSLCLIETGEKVVRDMFYDGHPKLEPGAVVCRLSPTFIRFGNFEFFAAKKDKEKLTRLLDYTINQSFPHIAISSKDAYIDMFKDVCNLTIDLIMEWKRVGFVHGVMNTDNMSIAGLTLDYGPYGWIDRYDEDWTPNTTDSGQKRYRFGQQDYIALWNLYQLANALYPCIGDVDALQDVLKTTEMDIPQKYYTMMSKKMGLRYVDQDIALHVDELRELMQSSGIDMTIFFWILSDVDWEAVELNQENILRLIQPALYRELSHSEAEKWHKWFEKYLMFLKKDKSNVVERQQRMKSVNPKYVLRNYMAQLAIEQAYEGEYNLIDELYEMLKRPYTDQKEYDHWHKLIPDWAIDRPGSSTLSCSS